VDDARQAYRLMGQIGSEQIGPEAARVTLIEDEVQNLQNRAQAMSSLRGSW
jgi:hypothetical protein